MGGEHDETRRDNGRSKKEWSSTPCHQITERNNDRRGQKERKRERRQRERR